MQGPLLSGITEPVQVVQTQRDHRGALEQLLVEDSRVDPELGAKLFEGLERRPVLPLVGQQSQGEPKDRVHAVNVAQRQRRRAVAQLSDSSLAEAGQVRERLQELVHVFFNPRLLSVSAGLRFSAPAGVEFENGAQNGFDVALLDRLAELAVVMDSVEQRRRNGEHSVRQQILSRGVREHHVVGRVGVDALDLERVARRDEEDVVRNAVVLCRLVSGLLSGWSERENTRSLSSSVT